MVARPDARMVEVPLEIEAELPRDFEGAAVLSSSGLPRKVKIKAQRDALKLSTAYRADQLLAAVGEPARGVLKGRGTAIEPFAEGLRAELRDRVAAHRKQAQEAASRCDKSAALAVEAERVLRAPREGVSQHLQTVSAQAAARVQALERVHGEVELYAASDLPLAERLVARLVEGPLPADPTGPLERQAQALVRVARKENGELRARLSRAAALRGWGFI